MMIDFDYLFQKYNIDASRGGILHLGASTGQEADTYYRLGYRKVIFVEAIPSVFEELKKHIGKYPEYMAVNACVGDEDGKEVVFNISNNEAQSSSYLELGHHTVIHPSVHYIDSIPLIMKRTDTLIDEIYKDFYYPILGINFLNADLQGSELQALKGLGERLHHFRYLYLEVNKKETYKGCALLDEVDEYVGKYGYKRVETGTWVADTWTDAFYIKNTLGNVD